MEVMQEKILQHMPALLLVIHMYLVVQVLQMERTVPDLRRLYIVTLDTVFPVIPIHRGRQVKRSAFLKHSQVILCVMQVMWQCILAMERLSMQVL